MYTLEQAQNYKNINIIIIFLNTEIFFENYGLIVEFIKRIFCLIIEIIIDIMELKN